MSLPSLHLSRLDGSPENFLTIGKSAADRQRRQSMRLYPAVQGLGRPISQEQGPRSSRNGFPCNQFGDKSPVPTRALPSSAPATSISLFPCSRNAMSMAQRSSTLQAPQSAAPGFLGTEAIKWNFTKFLVNRKGEVVYRSDPRWRR